MASASQGTELVSPRSHPSGDCGRIPAQLLERCRTGEEAAWSELVTRYERLVYGVALREGLAVDDAADVTQSVFETLFTSLHALREEERLSSWLYAVARRQAWKVRERRHREQPSSVATDGESAGAIPVIDPAGDLDRALSLHEAMQALGAPCRDLLTALYFDPAEPSYAEVAARLGRPVGSIGPARARCLQHLRAVLWSEDWR